MNYKEKQKIIQKALKFLHSCPQKTRKRRRKPHLRVFHLNNSKVFFELFIPKILKLNINDQYRRLKEIEEFLPKILSQKPEKKEDRYIFSYNSITAVVIEKNKKNYPHLEYFLLSFFPQ